MSRTIAAAYALTATRALLVALALLLCSPLQPYAQNKTACELIPLASISTTFGVEMFLRPTRPQLPQNCNYSSVGPFDRPTGPTVNLLVHWTHDPAPDSDAMVDAARVLLQQRQVQTTTVSGIGDAAFWFGNQITGELWVFRGGVDTLVLAGQLPLDKLKALAAQALGGSGRTGFAYAGTDTLNTPGPAAVAAAEPALVGGASFSQAIYITPGEFLKQVKEVSLTIGANAALTRGLSPAEQRRIVEQALASYGISVRTGAPVVLAVTFDQLDSVGTVTTTSTRDGTSSEQFFVHNVFASLDFYTRVVVVRNGQLHVVTAVPAHETQEDQYVEDSTIRKMLFGDQTRSDMKDLVTWLVTDSLDRIASNHAIDPTPWPVSRWTAAQKTTADAEFLQLINGTRSEPLPTQGLDVLPHLELVQPATDDPDEACPAPDSWRALWNAQFQRIRWATPQSEPSLTVRHSFYCRHIPVFRFPGGYYRLIDEASLRESNAAFVLNGRVFRKPATLQSADHLMTNQGDTLAAAVQMFVPQGISDFATRLGLVDIGTPFIAPAPVRLAPGTASPDDPATRARLFRPDAWERQWDVPFYRVSDYKPELARKGRLILRGTVARLSMDGTSPQWLRMYFREAPDAAVTLCTPSADIFAGFGDGYKGLIGRTVEAAGDIDGLCTPKGGIRILQSNQFRALSTEPAIP